MTLSKLIVLIVSLFLAFVVVGGLFSNINVVGGGAGETVAVIFLTVGFKATIDYFLNRRRKKREAKHVEKRSA